MTAPALSPEYQRLARAARPDASGGGPGAVDWEEVAALADHHRLAPLVWRMLTRRGLPDGIVPAGGS